MKRFDLEEYIANPNKKVITRDGRNVTILCTNYDYSPCQVIAQIEGEEHSQGFCVTGHLKIHGESMDDLFFAPEKNEGWINIFKVYDYNVVGQTRIFESEKTAIEEGKNYDNYFTTIKIEWEK